jgi:hypothetical protein
MQSGEEDEELELDMKSSEGATETKSGAAS